MGAKFIFSVEQFNETVFCLRQYAKKKVKLKFYFDIKCTKYAYGHVPELLNHIVHACPV